MKNKNKKMSNKIKRLNVLKILLLFCFSAVGHRILNKHAYTLLTSAAKQKVDSIVVNGTGSRGKDIMVIDKITNFGNPPASPWPNVVGQLVEPYSCSLPTFQPQLNTDGDEPGGHTVPATCSSNLSRWCNSAKCAYDYSYTFPIALSRALHYIQDMCCAVHAVPVSGTDKGFYSGSGYTDNQIHHIYEMHDKDATVSYSESRYGLGCGSFDSCSYSQMTQYLTDATKITARDLMNKTTGEFFKNDTLRLNVANKFKANIKSVVDKFKNRTATNATTTDNDIRTILLKDMALSAALMERCIKGSNLSNYFSIALPP